MTFSHHRSRCVKLPVVLKGPIMTDHRRSSLIVGALALSLVLNVVALLRIGDVQDEVDHVRSQASRSSNLIADLTSLQSQVDELESERELVTDLSWSIDTDEPSVDCGDRVPVEVSWSFREVPSDADVAMEIGQSSDDSWSQLEAEQTGPVDYRVDHEMSLHDDWEYRIVATNDRSSVSTDPQPANQLNQLTSKHVVFEEGETRSQDGTTWIRYVVSPSVEQITPCNEIIDASLTLDDEGSEAESIEMERGHPGDHQPTGYDEGAGTSGSSAFDDGIAMSEASESFDETDTWWTDWIEIDAPANPKLEITFGDGAVRSLDRIGPKSW